MYLLVSSPSHTTFILLFFFLAMTFLEQLIDFSLVWFGFNQAVYNAFNNNLFIGPAVLLIVFCVTAGLTCEYLDK